MSPNLKNKWFKGKIIKGKGIAKTFGYPTININNPESLLGEIQGVYLSRVKIDGKEYFGLLYYGPRLVLGENKDIVEIYIINFDKKIYGVEIEYKLFDFIRGILNFANLTELKNQIAKDFAIAQEMIK